MTQKVLGEIRALELAKKTDDPRYMELLIPNFFVEHLLRMPPETWPDPVQRTFKHINNKIYVPLQGPSELGLTGKLERWDRFADLEKITVPTLVVGAKHDTMDPAYMEKMSKKLPKGQYLYCPAGTHLAMYDDQPTYMAGVIKFLLGVGAGGS